MKKEVKVILVVLVILVIGVLAFYISNKINKSQEDEKNTQAELKTIEFVNTYTVNADLQMTDQTGNYSYFVIEKFQDDKPTVVKVDNKYKLEENEKYEFTFKGEVSKEDTEFSINEIFNKFEVINVQKTDKEGLEQRQDSISELVKD